MKKITLLFILSIAVFSQSFACINAITKVLTNGSILYEDVEGNVPYGHNFLNKNGFQKEIKELDILYSASQNLDYLSDKGLLFILLGKYNEAIDLYLEIEKLEPNRYSTASNIGTAYELVGQNENALKWIKRSVEIDSQSHSHSEWLHVKILEAKIKGKEFYTTAFLLNTDFGTEKVPTTSLSRIELEKLADALYFQLNERMSFVKPKEAIVAKLLFDLGNISFLLHRYDNAKADYENALKYGHPGLIIEDRIIFCENYINKEIAKREKELEQETAQKKTKQYEQLKYQTIVGLIGASILLLAIFVVYRRRNEE